MGLRLPVVAGAILVLAVVGAGLWFFLFRGGDGLLEEEAPGFQFELHKVESVALGGQPSKEALNSVAEELQATLDAMYSAGFVDPEQWQNGEFPAVLEAFTGEAAKGARKDLADLTLGAAAQEVESVVPGPSRLDVKFLLTPNQQPFAAVATTTFRAEGVLEQGGVLSVLHEGRYLMQRIEGQWLIVGYEVDGKLRPIAATPGGSP